MIKNEIIHLPVDDGFPIQSAPLTEMDIHLIQAYIKKSKANRRRRQRYAEKKALSFRKHPSVILPLPLAMAQ
jgi:hypothetical protein